MQINRFLLDPAGNAGSLATLPPQAVGAASLLRDPSPSANLDEQLSAYQDLSGQWRGARNLGHRAALAHVLNTSAFGQRVDRAVNSFTKAAWPGVDAVPPEPQVKMLQAFDGLPSDDQKIVASLQTDPATGAAFASPEAMRTHLQDQIGAFHWGRKDDQVTLSAQAQARLAQPAQTPEADTPAIEPANPVLARVLVAYAKAASSSNS
jgi:hypothetical protein